MKTSGWVTTGAVDGSAWRGRCMKIAAIVNPRIPQAAQKSDVRSRS